MKTLRQFFNRKSVGWWASIATLIGALIALAAWLWPNPLNPDSIETIEPTTIAESLQITDHFPPRNPGNVRILIARFDEVSQPNYKVTDLILANLRNSLSKYPDTEVLSIDRVITEHDGSDVAIKIGEAYDASIVIWGWYGLTENAVPLGIHFEIIQTSEIFHPNSCGVITPQARSQIRNADPIELSNLTLQTNLSDELSYVTLFTLGLTRYDAEDWENAISLFDDAITHLTDDTILSAKTQGKGILVDRNLLFYYRGQALLRLGNFDEALDDFTKVPNPDLTISLASAEALSGKGDIDEAIKTYSNIIDNKAPYFTSLALFKRGKLYEQQEKFELANSDFESTIRENQTFIPELYTTSMTYIETLDFLTKSISSNPNNPFYYYWRGIIYQVRDDVDKALYDFNAAIDLVPDFYVAREARSHVLIDKQEYDKALNDLNFIFKLDDFRTPCNLHNRGLAYDELGETENSKKDLLEVISLTTKAIEEDPKNAYAYSVRSLAYYTIGEHKNFLKVITTFQPNYYYSLRDKIKVRQLDLDLGILMGTCDNKTMLSLTIVVITPFLIWLLVISVIITNRKALTIFFMKLKNRIKTTRHSSEKIFTKKK